MTPTIPVSLPTGTPTGIIPPVSVSPSLPISVPGVTGTPSGVTLPTSVSIPGSIPISVSVSGVTPTLSVSVSGVTPPTSVSVSGVIPPTSISVSGVTPPTSVSISGAIPPTSISGTAVTQPTSVSGASGSGTGIASGSATGPAISQSGSSGAPTATLGTATGSGSSASVSGGSLSQSTPSGVSTGSAPPAVSSTPSGTTAASPVTSSQVTSAAATLTPLPFPTTGPTSNTPTGSDTLTTRFAPSTIVVEPTASLSSMTGSDTGLPSSLPQGIVPPGGVQAAPDNSTLIQLAFTKELNYPFVVVHDVAIDQIFTYIPEAIRYALEIDKTKIVMQSIMPYDTTSTQGFITTLAMGYIPSDEVQLLQDQLLALPSRFHNYQPDTSQVHQLVKYINPSFPLVAGSPGAALGGPSGTGNNGASPSTVVNMVDPIASPLSQSSTVNPTSLGIGFGVVFGAALYGGAMFFVAKRYKKRKSMHRRSPSLIDTDSMARSHPEMAGGAAAGLMGGGRGYSDDHDTAYYGPSGRTSRGSDHTGSSRGRDNISAPVMAENSLGWN